ncbi:unnamed protein product [Porites lobata]|uniref:Disease resistance R13L4/SHOC-2-like LRR domain-containing protein n=1 Tax=Porites lobata TaxID=104759 RepID=A0ABN8NNW7_9CNID|nr:unnamed protein product [Porites lobata]
MGNIESSAKIDVTQLQGLRSRELNISRSLGYEDYKEHLTHDSEDALVDYPVELLSSVSFYEKFDASFNCFTYIPSEFSMFLPHLSYIDMSHNRLASIPESFGLLVHLKTLLLNNNRLVELPETFCLLARLEKADLSHNQLRFLPQSLGMMESLQSLNVSYNELDSLPVTLGKSKSLKLILAIFNKCILPPQQICNQGSDAILSYLRNQNPKEIQQLLNVTRNNEFPRVRGDVLVLAPTNPHTARAQYVQTQTNTNATSRIKTPLRPPANVNQLPPDELVDKIVGCLYGAAIGDAIGLCTDFMMPDECSFYYDKDTLLCHNMIKDRHRSKWEKGDWTDSFDQTMLILENIIHWAGVVDELEFAKSILNWCKHGFPELGDTVGRGVRGVLAKVVCEPQFLNDPHGAAISVANKLESPSNGAIMRTSILGVAHFYDLNEVATNAVRICKATHTDPRCIASCVAVCIIIALILQGENDMESNSSVEELLEKAREQGKIYLEEPFHQKDFHHYFNCQTWEDVEVCEPRMTDYTFKPLGAGLVALRCMKDYKTAITELAMQGGHATCNATVAGALLGCKVGYSELPRDWIDGLLPRQVAWLNTKINCFLDMMALP